MAEGASILMGESVKAAELGFEEAVTDTLPVSEADGVVEQAVQGEEGVSTEQAPGEGYMLQEQREEGSGQV